MNTDIEKKTYYSTLFQYYQLLFTDKQIELSKAYFDEDYTLQEIADELEISKNAVWDTIKKVMNQLDEYESKLHLYQNDLKKNELLNELKNHCDEEGLKIIKKLDELE